MDDLARTVVMLRAGAVLAETAGGALSWWGGCAWCRLKRWLQWAHIHSRGACPPLRWDPDNALALCAGCHKFKWHGPDPLKVRTFLVDLLGERSVAVLALRAGTSSKADLTAQRIALEAEARKLMERRRHNA